MKRLHLIVLLVVMALLLLLVANRIIYGCWNPLATPARMVYQGRLYYPSLRPVHLAGADRPAYLAVTLNFLTGKKFYLRSPRGKYAPTVIYLYLGNGDYLPYELSGGP